MTDHYYSADYPAPGALDDAGLYERVADLQLQMDAPDDGMTDGAEVSELLADAMAETETRAIAMDVQREIFGHDDHELWIMLDAAAAFDGPRAAIAARAIAATLTDRLIEQYRVFTAGLDLTRQNLRRTPPMCATTGARVFRDLARLHGPDRAAELMNAKAPFYRQLVATWRGSWKAAH
ncbi:hypothetical protein NQK81_13225 [Amycolatopsis roodepoortensis]|uniref:hypothetical protein n=1 Tax=Amycolatopsis roodepoortensis TaxID=700274 RepID=UPI00214BE642|nr:hypothetical protein [Amycolatopsis roodepoortensis]UUV34366.1 hypothetical protein NQK81_13225 [Amycolatopsis roodepoortensis]